MKETEQLKYWTGEFSGNYIERNKLREEHINNAETVFNRIIANLELKSVLEIGSNIGINLLGIRKIFGEKIKLYAVEPNKKAFEIITNDTKINLEKSYNCDTSDIPLPDNSIDIVFTNGVLIHIHPNNLKQAISEIVRISKKYILCSEYFSHKPCMINYRGQENLLFKRDFGKYYLEFFPDLQMVSYGFLWQEEFRYFDNLNWWLFKKI